MKDETKLNRAKRRRIQKLAKKASREALEKMDEGLYNIFKATFNVNVNITDDSESGKEE